MDVKVRWAREKDVGKVKELTDRHRNELGFVRTAALEEAVREKRLLVSCVNSRLWKLLLSNTSPKHRHGRRIRTMALIDTTFPHRNDLGSNWRVRLLTHRKKRLLKRASL